MRLNLDTFVQVIVDGHRIIMPEVPAINCTQSLQIFAEDNIIIIGRMRLHPVIDSDKVTKIGCSPIESFLCRSGKLKGINNPISIIFAEKLFGYF